MTMQDLGEQDIRQQMSMTTQSRTSQGVNQDSRSQRIKYKSLYHKDAKHIKDWDKKVQVQFEAVMERLKGHKDRGLMPAENDPGSEKNIELRDSAYFNRRCEESATAKKLMGPSEV